jgi:inner membrane protein
MPSPVGHVLAGSVVALLVHRRTSSPPLSLAAVTIVCAAMAALPDADLVYQPLHRTVTHSLISIPIVSIVATVVTGWVTGRRSLWLGVVCGLAWGSHIPLDWLGADANPPQGIQALWPFSDEWFISGVDLFSRIERRQALSQASVVTNLKAVAREVVLLGPIVLWLWLGSGSGRAMSDRRAGHSA